MFYVVRAIANILFVYAMSSLVYSIYSDVARRQFSKYLSIPLASFYKKNTSHLLKNVMSESSYVANSSRSILMIISESLVMVFLIAVLVYANHIVTLTILGFSAVMFILILKYVSPTIKSIGREREKEERASYGVINNAFSSYKQLLLGGNNVIDNMVGDFQKHIDRYSGVNITNSVLLASPKFIIETFGFVFVVLFILVALTNYGASLSEILPVLTIFVLSLLRMLPSVNRIISGVNALHFYRKSIDIVGEALAEESEKLGHEPLSFVRAYVLRDVSFSYKENQTVFEEVNLSLAKGDRVGVIGGSGVGKSTLIDLLMGVMYPTAGSIKIDNVNIDESNIYSLRQQIGYVPQEVYLLDGSIKDNIVFGRELDANEFAYVLDKVKLKTTVKDLGGPDYLVGEGGCLLSGGQKQRIAIARALYSNPNILIIDEGTSALDRTTEEEIMDCIYGLSRDITIIIIAHRVHTLYGCDRVYSIENKRLSETKLNLIA